LPGDNTRSQLPRRRQARVGILVTKQVSGSAKIDPLMAAFNVIALMASNSAAASLRSPAPL
jgi:phage terminase large subunit-like protein